MVPNDLTNIGSKIRKERRTKGLSQSDLSKKLGLPQKLREVDIPKEACKKMAQDAMKQTRLLVNNPREVTETDALNIYQSAW